MSSPGQRRGACGHAMAIFDQHSYCARCREKNKGKDPCVESKDTSSCKFCSAFTPEQLAQISTPSYKIKLEKREARKSVTATPTKDSSELVDPTTVSVIGVVGQEGFSQQSEPVKSPPSSSMPPEKRAKKEKVSSKPKKVSDSSSTDTKIADLDSKWSERFNRLEALLLSKSFQPTFSSEVKLTPSHSPPTNIPRDSEPFLCQLTCQSADIMSSLCGVGVRVRVNNFSSKTTRPRDVLFFLKDALSIEDEKLFKACKSVCSSVC